jgi:hypothetical protein
MKQVPVKLGPMALLLAVISISLTVLSILNVTTARADHSLAEKYARTVSERYTLEIQGQEFLKDMKAGTASAGTMDENGVTWAIFEENKTRLRVGIAPDGTVVSWRYEKEWTLDNTLANLWAGV